ncbi:hypothetical protein ANCCAN_18337 [Ancylostoma caninum]|uniref:Cap-specific mRNA (nucleoside-2'-O-)-methyltransferase 2 n=1 Tax=Ancylostoma caninum TaxID=29170 RepID=A0A368FWB3_ANCCA|nr:hypothetical protein ANCCAN_18337 [Ancylostoma caninum]
MDCGERPLLDPAASIDREYCLRHEGVWSEGSGTELTSLKIVQDEINRLKERINRVCTEDDDGLRRWRLHTQNTHPLSMAPKLLREQFNCPGTSQAYCKFLEILRRYRLVPPTLGQLRSFHLCEAPGHFVSSLDRFLCTFYPKKEWFWKANSLNPHHEDTKACDMLLDDDLILRHPEQWYFGDDGSGDICKWDERYRDFLAFTRGFDLVTADGSLYTQDAPEEQESAILPLLQAEVEAAKKLLTFFGSLVIKIYTMFLPETRSLIQNIASYFDNVYVFKPMSSKGGNNEASCSLFSKKNCQRYLICMRFRGDRAKLTEQNNAETALISCEIYFSKLQSSFIEMNLSTYNVISKEELGVYRDRIFSEFHKRALTKFIATPARESHLNQLTLERPWIDMFEKNYVERLRCINDEQSALEHLRIFLREDLMSEHEECGSEVEVEFAEDELEFFEWEGYRLIHERVVIKGPVCSQIKHSLFVPPVLLRCLHFWKPETIIDLCASSSSHEPSPYAKSLQLSGRIVVDAAKLVSSKDWLFLLSGILNGVRNEKIERLEIVWSEPSIPFVLSRYSVSVIVLLSVMFFQFKIGGGHQVAVFTKPNYSEDIPGSFESYLTVLDELSPRKGSMRCCVPPSMLAMFHPYVLDLNRHQWRQLLDGEELGIK